MLIQIDLKLKRLINIKKRKLNKLKELQKHNLGIELTRKEYNQARNKVREATDKLKKNKGAKLLLMLNQPLRNSGNM